MSDINIVMTVHELVKSFYMTILSEEKELLNYLLLQDPRSKVLVEVTKIDSEKNN